MNKNTRSDLLPKLFVVVSFKNTDYRLLERGESVVMSHKGKSLFFYRILIYILLYYCVISINNPNYTWFCSSLSTSSSQRKFALKVQHAKERDTLQAWEDALKSVGGLNRNMDIGRGCILTSLAYSIYGEKLAGCGRDRDAVRAFDISIQISEQSMKNIGLSRARALQRLMRYKEARVAFNLVASVYADNDTKFSDAIISSVICSFRLGDVECAENVLEKFTHKSILIEGMRSIMRRLDYQRKNFDYDVENICNNLELMRCCLETHPNEFIFRWIWHLEFHSLIPEDRKRIETLLTNNYSCDDEVVRSLAKVNIGPFEAPQNIFLDNKVELHRLLAQRKEVFWPSGYILPDQINLFQKFERNEGQVARQWILKDDAGYGSHGNQILTTEEVYQKGYECDSPKLCQKIVNNAMLLDGRRFSIRLYVVYFLTKNGMDVYVCKEGLVKLASERALDSQDIIDKTVMTNSGREDDMPQQTLYDLQTIFKSRGIDYKEFWAQIRQLVSSIMITSEKHDRKPTWSNMSVGSVNPFEYLSTLSIPKILGYDLIVNENSEALLIEVNRFP